MNTLLAQAPDDALRAMSFKDAPDYRTAYAAALAHGLPPVEAAKCAYLKWLDTNEEHVRAFKLANRFEVGDEQHAMMDVTRTTQFLVLMLAEQSTEITALRSDVAALRADLLKVQAGGTNALTP